MSRNINFENWINFTGNYQFHKGLCIRSNNENIEVILKIHPEIIYVNYFETYYRLKCKYKSNTTNISEIYFLKNIIRIKNFNDSSEFTQEIINFCTRLIESSIKIQKYIRGFIFRLKIKNKNVIKIQKYVRGFVIRNIFYRCYHNKNTSCPFNKIRKIV